jgi:heme/copper-type cytochrome/quinol oxidase subunit 2
MEKVEFLKYFLICFFASYIGSITAQLLDPYWSLPDLKSRFLFGLIIFVTVFAYVVMFIALVYVARRIASIARAL